jgi:hypothetical protein
MNTIILSAAEDIMETWYENAWMWIIGTAIFIIFFAAIVSKREGDK